MFVNGPDPFELVSPARPIFSNWYLYDNVVPESVDPVACILGARGPVAPFVGVAPVTPVTDG